jgi:CheY-like chemotaxis protein
MLIDDAQLVIDVGKKMLELGGYQVTDFLDPIKALEHFSQQPQEFDLVMSDFEMPGMSGKELAKQMKAIRPDIPIVLVTGYVELVSNEDMSSWGIEGLLVKPYRFEEICKIAKDLIHNKVND